MTLQRLKQGITRLVPHLRRWGPAVVVGLAAVALLVVQFMPVRLPPEFFPKAIIIPVVLLLAGLGLAAWTLFLAPTKLWLRIAVVSVASLLALDSADWLRLHFDGDLLQMHGWRWPVAHWFHDTDRDAVLEADRKAHAPAGPLLVSDALPTDFPGYRGANRDGIVVGPDLRRDWSEPPKALWKQPVGGGYSGFAVVGTLAVTIEQRRDNEAVVAYDTITGREHWVNSWPARHFERMGGDGPRATPTVDNGQVFALGATGRLVCLEAATGQLVWQQDILDQNGNLQWGMAGSPLVHGSLVIVNPGVQQDTAAGGAVRAYNRDTGAMVWKAGDTQAGFASPMIATLGGQPQLLILDGDELAGYNPENGIKLWNFPWDRTIRKINVAQPVVLDGDRVFITSGYGVGGAMVKVDSDGGRWSASEWWRTRELKCRFSSPVAYQNHLYGLDEGFLVCLDAQTGEAKWRGDRYGHGQLLVSEDLLLVQAETGELCMVKASPEAFSEVSRFRALDNPTKNWNCPALSAGKVYVRNHEQMACYDLTATPPEGPASTGDQGKAEAP